MIRRLWLLKQKFRIRSSDASVVVKKNKPAEAPGSRDSASRLSCTGKPATKAGRFPLLAISGTLLFSARWDCSRKTQMLG